MPVIDNRLFRFQLPRPDCKSLQSAQSSLFGCGRYVRAIYSAFHLPPTNKMTALELKPAEAQSTESYVELRGTLAEAVVSALADEVSRKIIFSISRTPMTIGEISLDGNIPASTCYRRMKELLEEGLVVVDRIVVAADGRYAVYSSCFSSYNVHSVDGALAVQVSLNSHVAEKVKYRWISTSTQGRGITA